MFKLDVLGSLEVFKLDVLGVLEVFKLDVSGVLEVFKLDVSGVLEVFKLDVLGVAVVLGLHTDGGLCRGEAVPLPVGKHDARSSSCSSSLLSVTATLGSAE